MKKKRQYSYIIFTNCYISRYLCILLSLSLGVLPVYFLMYSAATVHAKNYLQQFYSTDIVIEPSVKALNPVFLSYYNDQDNIEVEAVAYDSFIIPPSLDLSHTKGIQLAHLQEGEVYPDYFNLRDKGFLTPVKEQGDADTCWAFASFASLESSLLSRGEGVWDLSENNMKNNHGFDIPHDVGGNYQMATAYLARWSGPVKEEDDPYNPYCNISPPDLEPVKHI